MGLVRRAEEWPWSSVYVRLFGSADPKGLLSAWPVPGPDHYVEGLNRSQPKEEWRILAMSSAEADPMGRRDG